MEWLASTRRPNVKLINWHAFVLSVQDGNLIRCLI